MFAEDINAFPSFEWLGGDGREVQHPVHGMSLRDYFAAAAVTGITTGDHLQSPGILAKAAYSIADAMLYEREHPF